MLQRTPVSTNAPFTLFQREGTRNWSMRYSLGGRQIKKSLKTANYDTALQRANEIYHEQKYRHKQGLSLVQHPFHEVAEEFIEKVCAEAERGANHRMTIPYSRTRKVIASCRLKRASTPC